MILVKGNKQVALCGRCGTELTDHESIARGRGPECAMTAAQQFSAIANLSLAMSTGYFDPIANKFFIEKTIIEAVLNRARLNADYRKAKEMTKKLQRVKGILAGRELYRLSRELKEAA